MAFNSTERDLAYEAFLQNPETHVETFQTSWAGIITAAISASCSVVGSSVIILFILKSDRGLSMVYHRIMFGMSILDVIQSLCMALTTLPMPTDMIYDQFAGVVAGTTLTCDIQGYVVMVSSLSTLMFNPILCIYYLLSIRYRMKDERFCQFIEPSLYIFVIVFNFGLFAVGTHHGQINPSPIEYPWCSLSRYPWWCDDDHQECAYERGNFDSISIAMILGNLVVVLSALLVLISMIMVTCHVYSQERWIRSLQQSSLVTREQTRLLLYKRNMQHTKDVVISALLYTTVFFTVWHYPFVRAFKGKDNVHPIEEIIRIVLRPSQGSFNAIIFIYHKIRNLQSHCPGITLRTALKNVFSFSSSDPEHVVSNLTLVRRNNQLDQLQFAFAPADEFDVDSEDDDSIHNLVDGDETKTSLRSSGTTSNFNAGSKSSDVSGIISNENFSSNSRSSIACDNQSLFVVSETEVLPERLHTPSNEEGKKKTYYR